MRSAICALTWEIWRRHRRSPWIVAGITLCGWLLHLVLPAGYRVTAAGREQLLTMNCLLMAASLFVVFGIFNYTEIKWQHEWSGFPYRLFALPVTSLVLAGVPICLGVAAVETVYAVWLKLVFTQNELAKPGWFGALIGTYMVFYQTILWTLAGFRSLRAVVLGLVGTSFVGVSFLPFFGRYFASRWFSESVLIPLLAALGLVAFAVAWRCVARQRSGGGYRWNRIKAILDRLADALPRRSKAFRDAGSAQLWFEWRRSGLLLPLCVGALLVTVIGPLSWLLRDDSGSALWLLAWTLAMPIILALPLGKGFSKPDFWSPDLALPPFLAVRPLSSGELVVTKLKVAALSAVASWLLVLAFLAIWLPLWANLSSLSMIRIGFWMAYGHSVYPQYAIAALSILAAMSITWKFLVGGLWIGLSGNWRFFLGSAAGYGLIWLLGMIGLNVLLSHDQAVRAWVRQDPNRLLSILEWIAALAIIAKFCLAARSWRNISPQRVRAFLWVWLAGTCCLITLAILLWARGLLTLELMALGDFLPLDAWRLGNLLILLAPLMIPFARLGLAPASLATNRHG